MNIVCQHRLHLVIQGAVQGVGFRPFVYRLATELELMGWIHNSAQGAVIEIEGEQSQVNTFLRRLESEQPPRSHIQQLNSLLLEPVGFATFEIRASVAGDKTAIVLPDIATCPDCLREIFDPFNRRYRYPFTNCTNCGPRFSIIEALPYDRPNTTMKSFRMCCHCQAEYENPGDRRFYAQPNACPLCGPHLELWNPVGKTLATHENALQMTAEAIRQGKIIAIKSLGGFHLIVDARNEEAVQRLRQVKNRAAKPFALMYPSLELIKAHCEVSELEDQLLQSPAAPIVLLKLKTPLHTPQPTPHSPHPTVAPNTPYLGIMLPYTPLHHLLMDALGFPVVATSGNLADEPICTDEHEAIQRLKQMADVLLVYNRPITRPIDDSVVRVISGQKTILRRARGYAPLPISRYSTRNTQHATFKILAVGGHLKNTIAFSMDQQTFLSQHIGNLETVLAFEAFQTTIASFQQIYELQPTAIACDLHPNYRSTQFAHQLAKHLEIPVIPVQHHYAHVLSCMAEHQLAGSALGIVWDGTGYGLDGTIWGGEFLHITDTTFQRVAHLRSFPLPGGDKAVKEPKRSAIGLLYELVGDELFEREKLNLLQAFTAQELKIIKTMLNQRFNTPITSSAGRLFDAIAAIIGLRQSIQFGGQAAMELEFAIEAFETDACYPFEILKPTNMTQPITIDWAAMVKAILTEVDAGLSIKQLSARFHNTLVEMMVSIAHRVGEERVVLTGGCFQNKYLTERAIQRLRTEGFCPYWHQRIPSNDGGIALGQIMAAFRELSGGTVPCV
ncbi:MAG: carbamoyltransferase HypF [Leptolyngbya sp. BL-A-14]